MLPVIRKALPNVLSRDRCTPFARAPSFRRPPLLAVLASLGASALSGCGGGGGNTTQASGNVEQFVLASVATEDGVVFSDRSVRTDGVLPLVGDLGADRSTLVGRQFLSFDLAPVPANALVTSAVLRLDLFVVVGSPFTTLGEVVVDHLDYGQLDANDFGLRALVEGLGPLSTAPTLGAVSLDVTAAVADDVGKGRARTQFRLRFSPQEHDADLSNDFVSFAEAEALASGQGQAPTLIVLARPR